MVFACVVCVACIAPARVGEWRPSHYECAVAPPIATMPVHGWRFSVRLAEDHARRWWAWNSDSVERSASVLSEIARLWARSAFLPIGGCR